MSLTVLLLNFPDETASILESVLVGATDIKNLSPVPLSSAVVGSKERRSTEKWRTAYGHRLILKSPDRIRFEAKPKSGGAKAAAFQHFGAHFASDIVLECFGSGAKVTKG